MRIITLQEGFELLDQIQEDEGLDYSGFIDQFHALEINLEMIDSTWILYKIMEEARGDVVLNEFLIYTPKKDRGNVKTLMKIMSWFENTAKENACNSIKIGANFKYKDESFGKFLEKKGYVPDTYRKDI